MVITASKTFKRLHQLIMHSRIPRTVVENDDILLWISAVSAATIGMNSSQKVALVRKFECMVQTLETLELE